MKGYNTIGKWLKNFNHAILFHEKFIPESIKFTIDRFRAFTELQDNEQVLIYGDYDIVCCYPNKEEEKYQGNSFKKAFVEIINLQSIKLNYILQVQEVDFKVYMPYKPKITLSKEESRLTLSEIFSGKQNNVLMEISGEICCEVLVRDKIKQNETKEMGGEIILQHNIPYKVEVSDVKDVDDQHPLKPTQIREEKELPTIEKDIKTGNKDNATKEQQKEEPVQKQDKKIEIQRSKAEEKQQIKPVRDMAAILEEYSRAQQSPVNYPVTQITSRSRNKVINNESGVHKVVDKSKLNMSKEEYERMKIRAKEMSKGGG